MTIHVTVTSSIFGVSTDGRRSVTVQCDPVTLGWLVGLLEGEGSFMTGPPSRPNLPRISIQMSDADVMDKFGALTGLKVCLVNRREDRPTRKDMYHCQLSGSRAVALMILLEPFMGERRQAQIARALASYEPLTDLGKIYPTRDQLLSHGMRPTKELASHYGVSRQYVDRLRGPLFRDKSKYPSRDELLAHGNRPALELAGLYGVSRTYIDKTRGPLRRLAQQLAERST